MLAEGDVLTVWIRETENSGQIRPVKLPFAIVYEDEDSCDQQTGRNAGSSIRGNPENSLGNALGMVFQRAGFPLCSAVSNRLDRDTSGLTIVAKLCGFCGDPRADGEGQKPSRD